MSDEIPQFPEMRRRGFFDGNDVRATADDIRDEIRNATARTNASRIAYEQALRYEGRMILTLELMEREEGIR